MIELPHDPPPFSSPTLKGRWINKLNFWLHKNTALYLIEDRIRTMNRWLGYLREGNFLSEHLFELSCVQKFIDRCCHDICMPHVELDSLQEFHAEHIEHFTRDGTLPLDQVHQTIQLLYLIMTRLYNHRFEILDGDASGE